MNETARPPDRIQQTVRVLGWILLLLAPVYVWMVWSAPTDSIQGTMQKILYVHPPLAWVRGLCPDTCLLAGTPETFNEETRLILLHLCFEHRDNHDQLSLLAHHRSAGEPTPPSVQYR